MIFEGQPERIKEAISDVKKSEVSRYLDTLVVSPEQLVEQCEGDSDLTEILNNMFDLCDRYNETVLEYKELLDLGVNENNERFVELEDKRTKTHNATIDSINILARNLTKKGFNAKWVKELSNRGAYGRFAILVSFSRLLKEESPAMS